MADGNPNIALFDDQVRRRVSLERYSNGQIRNTAKLLTELEGDIRAKIAKATPTSKRQLEALLRDVREIQGKAYETLNKRLGKDFETLAGEEARFQSASLGAVVDGTVSRLTVNAAITAANARPMQGALLKDWLTNLDKNARARIEKALRISFIEGESLSATFQRLKDVTGINRRGLEALIRTANTHIAAAVQQASYEENGDLIEELEWRATLDSRTTLICASRDGQRFPLKSGPRPPAHISCRSIMTPVLSKFPPPPRDNYSDWLKRQPESVQDEILGKGLAAAFRKGAPLTSFVNKVGKTKSLKDLGLEGGKKAAPKPKAPKPKKPEPVTVGRGRDVVNLQPMHGMRRAARMTRTNVAGIDVFEPAAPSYTRHPITQDALDKIANGEMPAGLTNTTRSIVISRDRNRHDSYWAKRYRMPGFRSGATGGDEHIVIYGLNNKTSPLEFRTAAHEMGHNLQKRLYGAGGDPGPEYTALWNEAKADRAAERWVRDYGSAAATEDFSTAVELYVSDPETLRKRAPKRFAIIDRMVRESATMGPINRT